MTPHSNKETENKRRIPVTKNTEEIIYYARDATEIKSYATKAPKYSEAVLISAYAVIAICVVVTIMLFCYCRCRYRYRYRGYSEIYGGSYTYVGE